MSSEKYIVSACMLGLRTKFNGEVGEPHARCMQLLREGRAIPVCPEQLGGLSTPRPPCELHEGRVVTPEGDDVTEAFELGARQTLELARNAGCTHAVLKARSPSCGSGRIYDGTFSGRLVPGDGVAAALLRGHGITVINEEDF